MSKRKRLTPLSLGDAAAEGPLETKAMYPLGVAPTMTRRAPIADVAGNAAALAALEEVTEAMARARAEGRMVLSLSLDQIELDHLVRDRMPVGADDEDMSALIESLRARGQQTPIEVCDLGEGRYGLISGWRRCQALKVLHQETKQAGFGTVLALLRQRDEAAGAYQAMVEENEIRVGLSYYERARIVAKAVDQGVFETEKAGLQCLFHSASRAKRSKIGSFLTIVRALDGVLRFGPALGERAGLKLAKALSDDADRAARLRDDLVRLTPTTAAEEMAVLEQEIEAPKQSQPPKAVPKSRTFEPRAGVRVEVFGDGRMVIRGTAVDADLHGRLLVFLAGDD